MSLAEIFGNNVRAARRKLDWSQEDLAFKAGLKRTYLSEIEGGKRNPTLDVVERIAKALSLSASALLEGGGE